MPSVVIGLIGITVSFYLDQTANLKFIDANLTKTDSDPFWWSYLYGNGYSLLSLSLFLILVGGGRFLFKKQTPRMYAKHSIEGRPFSRSANYIAYCVWKEMQFWRSFWFVRRMLERIVENEGSEYDKDHFILYRKWVSTCCILFIRKVTNRRSVRVERINHMMVYLSESMRVPAHRICDALFQFSPNIYTSEYRLASKKMSEILNSLTLNDASDPRRKKHAQAVLDFLLNKTKRADYQVQIINNTDLHDILIDMSMGFGMSSALSSYCMGLTKIAQKRTWLSSERLTKKMKFLYHKRNLFPGIDIHLVAMKMAQNCGDDDEKLYHALKELKELKTNKVDENFKRWFGVSGKNLNKLMPTLDKQTFKQRDLIDKKFISHILNEINQFYKEVEEYDELEKKKNAFPKVVLLTQGYSSVVNRALQNLALELKKFSNFEPDSFKEYIDNYSNCSEDQKKEKFILLEDNLKEHENLIREFGANILNKENTLEIHYYVLVSPEELDDEHRTISRYTRFNFKETPNFVSLSSGLINVKLGNVDWFMRRFWNNKNRIYRVSGAEFMQLCNEDNKDCPQGEEPEKYRLINNEGYNNLENLAENLAVETDSPRIRRIVLAENFKRFEHPLDKPFDQILNQDQLEFIQFYQWSDRDKVRDKIIMG